MEVEGDEMERMAWRWRTRHVPLLRQSTPEVQGPFFATEGDIAAIPRRGGGVVYASDRFLASGPPVVMRVCSLFRWRQLWAVRGQQIMNPEDIRIARNPQRAVVVRPCPR